MGFGGVRGYTGIIRGRDGQEVKVTNGALNTAAQDQTTRSITAYLCASTGMTTLSADVSIDDRAVIVESTTGAAVGDCIDILEDDRFFQSIVMAINGSTISFASPLDYEFNSGATVCFGEWDASTLDGSVTPKFCSVLLPPNAVWDIYTLTIAMLDSSAMDDGTFGGQPQLANGIVGRREDGTYENLFLVVNNGGFREQGFTVTYPVKPPSGTYAVGATKNFKEVEGVAKRLVGSEGDTFKTIIQDDLTQNDKIAFIINGHLVE